MSLGLSHFGSRGAALLALALLHAACSGDGAESPLREPDAYEGCGTDEHWPIFDSYERSGTVIVDPAQAPLFLTPAEGGSVPSGSRFRWAPGQPDAGMAYGTAQCGQCDFCGQIGGQHLPSVSGWVYDLQLSAGGKVVWRVITSLQEWTPAKSVWSLVQGQPVTLVTVGMELVLNQVQSGPYRAGTPLTFTAVP